MMPMRMMVLYGLVLVLGITGAVLLWPVPEPVVQACETGCSSSGYRPAWVGTERAERFASVFR
jgi:hypothetical protein